ncbi:MAG: DegT/DnrJ/EryC1/StrS family aminotransferase [Candidatus Omnitrophica bacterium]|nr:DegT/DnrJ/EryC1/StrS family aminotransferase [Candidatus Omnitrophota bacterium]
MTVKGKRNLGKRNLRPAVLGGKPAFNELISITKPTITSIGWLRNRYGAVLKSGVITNAGNVREFEKRIEEYCGVKNAVAVSSCTSGLMLVLKTMNLKGEVILPSFTFHSTAHAVAWAGLKPVFVDCDNRTFNIDSGEVERVINSQTSAVIGVHLFGNPCNVKELERIAKRNKLALLFDSAHGFGAQYKGHPLGSSGDAEVFSLSPTKLLTAGEGGIVTTNDDTLARNIRVGRNYGDAGTYSCEFSGLNARMSELHALLGISSLENLERNVQWRNKLVRLYKSLLSSIPGIRFQEIREGDRSSFKDFSIVINEKEFGLNRDVCGACLEKENIGVKKYFYPAVHTQKAFARYYNKSYQRTLRTTVAVSENILSLPLYSHMKETHVRKICACIEGINRNKLQIQSLWEKNKWL